MNLWEFKHLSEEDQQYVLQKKAVHIATINDEQESLELFQVDSFYIEIECIHSFLKVITVNFFDETSLLEPYLESINIEEIFDVLNSKN